MNAGRTITIAILGIALAGAEAHANKKTEADTAAPAEKAQTAEKADSAKTPKAAPAVERRAPKRQAIEVAPPPQIEETADSTPWFEAPLRTKATKPAAEPATKTKKATPRYGTDLRLGQSRAARRAPSVAAESESRRRKLTRGEVQAVVRANINTVRYCHRKASSRGETSSQMVLKFEVDDHGKAHSVQVTELSGRKLKRMSRCMSRRMRSWKLPENTLGGPIEYPLAMGHLTAGR